MSNPEEITHTFHNHAAIVHNISPDAHRNNNLAISFKQRVINKCANALHSYMNAYANNIISSLQTFPFNKNKIDECMQLRSS
jgi:UDP-3-O-acyl-N-acetylglucosamine deacetylase